MLRSMRDRALKLWRWRAVRLLAYTAMLLFAVYLFRHPLLRAAGRFLITEDPAVHGDAIYALGGASLERGIEAARLYGQGLAPKVICTSEVIPSIYRADGIDRTEAQVTRDVAIRAGVPVDRCATLERGTSTQEESEAILEHARAGGQDTIIIVSSMFHLRRIGFVFRDRFAQEGITVVLRGAASSTFKEEEWWQYEDGLIMCQNEYVKLLYYWWKY
jgi:uncharacterized SAM-binding protein YcdF (DUF218 family)